VIFVAWAAAGRDAPPVALTDIAPPLAGIYTVNTALGSAVGVEDPNRAVLAVNVYEVVVLGIASVVVVPPDTNDPAWNEPVVLIPDALIKFDIALVEAAGFPAASNMYRYK